MNISRCGECPRHPDSTRLVKLADGGVSVGPDRFDVRRMAIQYLRMREGRR